MMVKIILAIFVNFNSIKVRLKRINPYFALGNIERFQFHKGTIKTMAIQWLQANSSISIP